MCELRTSGQWQNLACGLSLAAWVVPYMKKHRFLALLATTSAAYAGAPTPVTTPEAKADYWITPTLDVRARYEFADIDGFDSGNAMTVRERLGLKTKSWNGLSAVVEGEFTQAIVDDYNAGPAAARVHPYEPRKSSIFDPENNELNQLYAQYVGFDTTVKVGRQKLIYDNACFVGDVGWRQNQQTYDGITLSNTSISGLTANYAYVDRVNRIFGADADGVFDDTTANIHLFNASYTGIKTLTLGAYAYLMDFQEKGSEKWDNNTYGISAKEALSGGLTLYGELAYQQDAGNLNDKDGYYAHFYASQAIGKHTLMAGVESLGDGVQTPLGTVHAFDGYADSTDTRRIDGTHGGLTDTYVSYAMPIFWGMKWTNVAHIFGSNSITNTEGFGYDSVLAKKFDDHFTAIAKLGYFDSANESKVNGYATTTRVSLQLDYTF
jgi:Alginate export